jgi:hypothetical protein
MSEDTVTKAAGLSEDGFYRYWLSRTWNDAVNPLPIVMLNPSTADAEVDDPTINKCMKYARRENYGGIYVVNLFAYRATQPSLLATTRDPVGPENDARLFGTLQAAQGAGCQVLCGWGANPLAKDRAETFLQMALEADVDLRCLAVTKFGAPQHPLYCLDAQEFVQYGYNPKEGASLQA